MKSIECSIIINSHLWTPKRHIGDHHKLILRYSFVVCFRLASCSHDDSDSYYFYNIKPKYGYIFLFLLLFLTQICIAIHS